MMQSSSVPLVMTVHDLIPALSLRGELEGARPGRGAGWILRRAVANLKRADAVLAVIEANRSSPSFHFCAGIFSILMANLLSSVVSAQIYGDPFIAMFITFLTGLALSFASARSEGMEESP